LPDAVRIWLLLGVTIGIAVAVLFWWWQERLRAGITSWFLVFHLFSLQYFSRIFKLKVKDAQKILAHP